MGTNTNTKTKNMIWVMVLLSTVILRGDTCGGGSDLLMDSGFDLWCGDTLCSWELDEGEIAKASTWHARDLAVDLKSETVQLSQRFDGLSVLCMEFSFVADVDASAHVWIGIDFLGDGTIPIQERIPVSNWQRLSYKVRGPGWSGGARFIIRKESGGRAVLAQMRLRKVNAGECVGAPVEVRDRPLGVECEDDSDCTSSICSEVTRLGWAYDGAVTRSQRCGGCRDTNDCGGEEVCGQDTHDKYGFHLACGASGRHVLGEICVDGAECTTGVCCEGICSTCCGEEGCTGDSYCVQFGTRPGEVKLPPQNSAFMCSPGRSLGTANDFCLLDADCASGRCESDSDLKVCFSNQQRCDTKEDCPSSFVRACVPVGKEDGRCL